jgi:hypothetical protein
MIISQGMKPAARAGEGGQSRRAGDSRFIILNHFLSIFISIF